MVFKLQSRHKYMIEITVCNIQRAITRRVGKPKLWFLCSALRLMIPYICLELHESISKAFQLTEWARFCVGQKDRQTDWQEKQYAPHPKSGDIISMVACLFQSYIWLKQKHLIYSYEYYLKDMIESNFKPTHFPVNVYQRTWFNRYNVNQ